MRFNDGRLSGLRYLVLRTVVIPAANRTKWGEYNKIKSEVILYICNESARYMTNDVEIKYDSLVYELLKDRYNSEMERIDSLDQKANNTIGFAGIILSFVSAAGVYLIKDVPKSSNFYIIYSSLFLLGIIMLGISIFFALRACSVKDYDMFPEDPDPFIKKLEKVKRETIVNSLPAAYRSVLNNNRPRIDEKAEFLKRSFKYLSAGIFINLLFIASMLLLRN